MCLVAAFIFTGLGCGGDDDDGGDTCAKICAVTNSLKCEDDDPDACVFQIVSTEHRPKNAKLRTALWLIARHQRPHLIMNAP